MANLEEIERSYQLLRQGVITQAEFEAIKNEALTPRPICRKSRVCAGLLALFLGGFGAHKFYLGYTTQALNLLAITIFAVVIFLFNPYLGFVSSLLSLVVAIICIIEAIQYLTKTDDEFNEIYVEHSRYWF